VPLAVWLGVIEGLNPALKNNSLAGEESGVCGRARPAHRLQRKEILSSKVKPFRASKKGMFTYLFLECIFNYYQGLAVFFHPA